jgi:hypothetical protein
MVRLARFERATFGSGVTRSLLTSLVTLKNQAFLLGW